VIDSLLTTPPIPPSRMAAMQMEEQPEGLIMQEDQGAQECQVSYTNLEALLEHGIAAADIEKVRKLF